MAGEGVVEAVRALRECPHLRIEIWGTRFCGSNLDMGHSPEQFTFPLFAKDGHPGMRRLLED